MNDIPPIIWTEFRIISGYCKEMTFEEDLRKHGLEDNTIVILKRNGIASVKTLRALKDDDVKALGLSIGQAANLKELIQELKSENMDETEFWCLFNCLGGIGAVGIGGILALVALVTYGLPAIGFGAAGIAAGSLAANIMALYGGTVAAGSVLATLQSVAAAGLGWHAILTAFFGSTTVMTAVQGACSHCFK